MRLKLLFFVCLQKCSITKLFPNLKRKHEDASAVDPLADTFLVDKPPHEPPEDCFQCFVEDDEL